MKDINLDELVDSRLEGAYDVEQMKRLLLAASLCVGQSSQRRPQMSRVCMISLKCYLQKLHNSQKNWFTVNFTSNSNKMITCKCIDLKTSSDCGVRCAQVLQILCSDQSRIQTMRTRNVTLEREDSSSIDLEECDINIAETSTFGGSCATDIKTHFALAMLGVDDVNSTLISRNSLDHRGVDRLHSSKYLEAYLEGLYSSSSSLVK